MRCRHLILLGGQEGEEPQYLGVEGAAALMGLTPTIATAQHAWLATPPGPEAAGYTQYSRARPRLPPPHA